MRLAGALVLLVLLGGPAAAQPTWTSYRDPDGRFEAAFPGEPKIADVTDASGRRKRDLIVELADDESYIVSVSDFPPGTQAGVPAAQVLEKVESALKQGLPGAVVTGGEPVLSGQWQGRELTVRDDKGLIRRARFFWVGTTLYQAVAVVGEVRAAQAPVGRFLDSFKILKK